MADAHPAAEVLVIDDLRTFTFPARYARTSGEGLDALATHEPLTELWLDHDLGGDDTIMPVIDHLAERAFNEQPYPVARIVIHTSNPSGAETMERVLRRWGYPVVRVTDLTDLLA